MTIRSSLFSIITITRNNLDGFLRTKASIEAQSFGDFEWVVVDGNSTDGTKKHLPENALSGLDTGIYDAMNKGMDRAQGDYLLFLNAGDALSDADILATLAKTITAEKPDFIYGDALEDNGFYKKARSHEQIDYGMFTHHQAMVYQRNAVGERRYDTGYRIAGDYAFTRAFLVGKQKISYVPCAFCIFESGGVSQRHMRLGRNEQYKARQMAGCNFFKNVFVYAAQSGAAALKNAAPRLYFRAKARISS